MGMANPLNFHGPVPLLRELEEVKESREQKVASPKPEVSVTHREVQEEVLTTAKFYTI